MNGQYEKLPRVPYDPLIAAENEAAHLALLRSEGKVH